MVTVFNIEVVLVTKTQSDDTSHSDTTSNIPHPYSEILSLGELSAVEVPNISTPEQAQYLEQQQSLIDQTNVSSSPYQSLHDITDTHWVQTISSQMLSVVPQSNPQTEQQL